MRHHDTMRGCSLLLALLLLASTPARADDDWFAIEVIVFEHRGAPEDTEEFPRDPGQPELLTAALLLPPTVPATLQDFEQLDRSAMQLAGAWRSLQRSSRYTPLVMAGWIQVARAPGSAQPVAIELFTGEPLQPVPLELPLVTEDALEEVDAAPADEMPGTAGPEDVKPTFESGDPPWIIAERLLAQYLTPRVPERLRGTVRLHVQRFLHVELDLVVATDTPLPPDEVIPGWHEQRDTILDEVRLGLVNEATAMARLEELQRQPQVATFRLRDSRQMRSGEIHYFDHPRLGVIVTVRPVSDEERELREQNLLDAMTQMPSEPTQDPF